MLLAEYKDPAAQWRLGKLAHREKEAPYKANFIKMSTFGEYDLLLCVLKFYYNNIN